MISTTVGIPITTTSIPNVFLLSSPRSLLIPLPGLIPLLVIWIVLVKREMLFAFSESIIIIFVGLITLIILLINSYDSIPVFPITDGLNLDTLE